MAFQILVRENNISYLRNTYSYLHRHIKKIIWTISAYSGNVKEYTHLYVTKYINWQRFIFLFTMQSMRVWKHFTSHHHLELKKGRQQKVSIIYIHLEIIEIMNHCFRCNLISHKYKFTCLSFAFIDGES